MLKIIPVIPLLLGLKFAAPEHKVESCLRHALAQEFKSMNLNKSFTSVKMSPCEFIELQVVTYEGQETLKAMYLKKYWIINQQNSLIELKD